VIVCVILTGDVRVVAQPPGLSESDEDALLGVSATDKAFVAWSSHSWFVYSLDGLLLSTSQLTNVDAVILSIDLLNVDDSDGQRLCIVWKTGLQGIGVTDDYTQQTRRDDMRRRQLYVQSSVIAVSSQRQRAYSCDDNNDVICYDSSTSGWTRRDHWTLNNRPDQLYSLLLSPDDTLLIGQVMSGFKRWHLTTKRLVKLQLPSDVRNFPR